MEKLCGNCALQKLQSGICPIFKQTVNPEDTGCPMYKSYIDFCELCGNAILSGGIIDTNTAQPHLICDNCEQILNSCASCFFSLGCAFEQDPSTIPKYTIQEVRKGNAILRQTVKNPKRIDETCKAKCSCFDPTFGCLRQNNYCEKWKIKWNKD